MVREYVQIYNVQITGKCISETFPTPLAWLDHYAYMQGNFPINLPQKVLTPPPHDTVFLKKKSPPILDFTKRKEPENQVLVVNIPANKEKGPLNEEMQLK